MQLQRVTALLQGVADVRNWVVQNIPAASSLAGYDLFIKITNDYLCGKPLVLDLLSRELPHDEQLVRAQILTLEQAGLMVEQPMADGGAIALQPTKEFIALVARYQAKFESLFILRKGLRDEQLLVATDDAKLRHFTEALYDHFYDMGWLYLHNFGGICFLMASLVQRAAIAYGHQARVVSGYVEIVSSTHNFKLGGKGFAAPGQIEGHAMCVIDEALIVDFGLGNARRAFRRDFYWALACPYRPQAGVLGQMVLPQGLSVRWKDDWQTPETQSELDKFAPMVEQLFGNYLERYS
jgi:hypothetical protein